MASKRTELESLIDRASQAWRRLADKERRALETALQARRDREELERVIELHKRGSAKAA